MKAAPYGRIVFGASAMLLGVVELLWRNSEMWRVLHPVGATLAAIFAPSLALVLFAGGIAVMYSRTARAGSAALGAVYALFSLAYIPGMIAAPGNPALYVVFFENFSVVCGAAAVFAGSLGSATRLGFGLCTISFAWAQVVYFTYTASLVPTWIPPGQGFWTILTTIAFALAGISMLINVQARLALRLMVVMLALFGLLVWVPRIAAHPAMLSNWNELASNYLMTAAAWLVARLVTEPAAQYRTA